VTEGVVLVWRMRRDIGNGKQGRTLRNICDAKNGLLFPKIS
jgi:hypothetical protein